MRKLIRELFFLRKGERRALYVVMLLLFISALVRIYISTRPLPEFQPDDIFTLHMEEIREQIDSLLKQEQARFAAQKRRTGKWINAKKEEQGAETRPLRPVTFDPNTADYDALLSMNLSAYVSRNIIRYREAGGIFHQPSDLEKIYGLEKEVFDTLMPYIIIAPNVDTSLAVHFPGDSLRVADRRKNTGTRRENTFNGPGKNNSWYDQSRMRKDSLFPIELNGADSADLIALPGIGPWFAGRIIRYRELLGGFVNTAQLLEVYGMDTARFNGFASRVTTDTVTIKRINLNNSTFHEVISHPYINREEAYAIFRYRDFVDSIRDPENILKDQIIDRERFMRMVPYLTVRSMAD